ncbi:RNA-binding protein Musashi homolog 2-like isoform X1 [Orbicella faveolata]|uniref:RNA-binding protein Musashi homolog 2-like isoform X1 n=1 Tax=Orbicella faveolata TaxID=48498 RepID=UPI0009E427E9|nr:RNA-binding protein Musashi homolog 2-like isoform X1 [Orbicella faveolata]
MEADSPQPSGASKVDLPNDPGKMFVGGLSWETTAEGLQTYFSKYGDLKECLVMRDPNTKQSRGFGFVTFEDPAAVDAVLKAGPHELDHKKIDPKVAVPKRPQPKMVTRTKKIFVGGVSASTTEEDLTNYFKQHGEVSEAKLMYDKVTHRHRGFGFVTFESEDAAESACEEQFHLINDKKTEVKKAQPREVMQSLQGGRGRAGRTLAGRGFLYNPFAPGFPRGFAPSGFGPGFGSYPFPGSYPAAAAAAAAFAAQNRQVRGKGRGYLGNYPGMLGFTGYPAGYMNPADQRGRTPGGQYYAEYATINNQGGRSGPNRPPDIPQVNPAMQDYTDYPGMNYPTQAFGPPPPSPVSRAFATAATSPGPVQDLSSYINSATNTTADGLGYTATSPQPTGFGHAMAIAVGH